MKVVFEDVLTGLQIKERNPNKTDIENDRKYFYSEGSKDIKGVIECTCKLIPTDEEIQSEKNRVRKEELIKLMIEANAIRDDKAWQQYKDEYDTLV